MCAIYIFLGKTVHGHARLSISLFLSLSLSLALNAKSRMNCLQRFDLGNFSIWFLFFFPLAQYESKSKSIWIRSYASSKINAYATFIGNCEKGCYISGLFIEGAGWSIEHNALVKSNNLVEPLPILRVIPMERHKLQTQVCKMQTMWF